MSTLICGSLAYDFIMKFEGRLKDNILPEYLDILNVSFLVPTMRREFGGCAGNIAYALQLLGDKPEIMATLGELDGQSYLDRLKKLGISDQYIRLIPETYSAQCMITADIENNQIAVFHPGAMQHATQNQVKQASDVQLGIVSPDSFDAMIQHAQHFSEQNIPFIFDPGQGLPLFNSKNLQDTIALANYLTLNEYEAELVLNKTGWSKSKLISTVDALIITLAERGSVIYHHNQEIHIPPVKAKQIIDPTGCGDAFRGGLLYGLTKKFDWETTGRLASLMGSLKIAVPGPQNYHYAPTEIFELFHAEFGYQTL